MVLDEPKQNDMIFTEKDITFAIDKKLLEKSKPIRIEFLEAGGQSGFLLISRDLLFSLVSLQDFISGPAR